MRAFLYLSRHCDDTPNRARKVFDTAVKSLWTGRAAGNIMRRGDCVLLPTVQPASSAPVRSQGRPQGDGPPTARPRGWGALCCDATLVYPPSPRTGAADNDGAVLHQAKAACRCAREPRAPGTSSCRAVGGQPVRCSPGPVPPRVVPAARLDVLCHRSQVPVPGAGGDAPAALDFLRPQARKRPVGSERKSVHAVWSRCVGVGRRQRAFRHPEKDAGKQTPALQCCISVVLGPLARVHSMRSRTARLSSLDRPLADPRGSPSHMLEHSAMCRLS